MDATSLVKPGEQVESLETVDELPGTLDVPERPSITAPSADIYRGFWTSPQGERIEVAIKEFKTPTPRDRNTKQEELTRKVDLRLKREAYAWSQTTHPNIHPLLGYCSRPRPRLISPWCHYGNLNDYLEANKGLTRCDKLRLIFQIACGLEHLHSRTPPICHADIKPENVLINCWSGAALSDFGLSRVVQDSEARTGFTTSETVKGSMRYMARELFSGQKPSLETDIYAFGGLILTVMSGKAPFDGHLHPVILRRVMQDEPPIPEDHPSLPAHDPLWKLMGQCWNYDPTARPTMQDVLRELVREIDREKSLSGARLRLVSVASKGASEYCDTDLNIPGAAFSGCWQAEQPNISILRTDRQLSHYPTPKSLKHYRALEGEESRDARLRSIWLKLLEHRPPDRSEPVGTTNGPPKPLRHEDMTNERAESLQKIYWEELRRRTSLDWDGFLTYVDEKEAELWSFFHEQLDLDGNGHLDAVELGEALSEAGIRLTTTQLSDFMAYLASTPHSPSISFPEFRDFLLLLPRKASTLEMYRYYAVRRFLVDSDDGHGVVQVNMEGDLTPSAEYQHPLVSPAPGKSVPPLHTLEHDGYDKDDEEEREEGYPRVSFFARIGHSQTFEYLLAGGLAGAASRTATAPFDRLRVFLITSSGLQLAASNASASQKSKIGVEVLMRAISHIRSEAGYRSFWVGNGLNVLKIFPEPAIRFLSDESSKRFIAKHVDQVDDVSKISGVNRFISGGIGGIVSQISTYPLETLKTQIMSSDGHAKDSLSSTLKRTWNLGGVPAFYRGLMLRVVGVFPFSAIDMSTFETLKILSTRSTDIQEPGVLKLLAFSSISGTVGAASVYPLNLVRTRLQAAGSPGHPHTYTGFRDAVHQIYKQAGWKGFYRGLVPTLVKVVPAVSISHLIFENSRRWLGVGVSPSNIEGYSPPSAPQPTGIEFNIRLRIDYNKYIKKKDNSRSLLNASDSHMCSVGGYDMIIGRSQ